MFKQSVLIDLEPVECCACGVVFGMTEQLQNERRKDGKHFYCPNGHAQHYGGKTYEQLQKELKEAERNKADAERRAQQYSNWYEAETKDHHRTKKTLTSTKKALSSTKGQLTKTKNRVANGVCPCCSRHFANLERHMKGQHPDYQEEGGQP